jgi:hypothetical protein
MPALQKNAILMSYEESPRTSKKFWHQWFYFSRNSGQKRYTWYETDIWLLWQSVIASTAFMLVLVRAKIGSKSDASERALPRGIAVIAAAASA